MTTFVKEVPEEVKKAFKMPYRITITGTETYWICDSEESAKALCIKLEERGAPYTKTPYARDYIFSLEDVQDIEFGHYLDEVNHD